MDKRHADYIEKLESDNQLLRAALSDMVFHGGRVNQKGFKQKAYYEAFCDAYSNAKELVEPNRMRESDNKEDIC